MPDWRFRGYVEHAAAVIADANERSPKQFEEGELQFLINGFNDARDRMTTLASTVGTAGSFLLVLVALMVGLATKANDQADKLLAASNVASRLARGCSDDATSRECDATKLEQARSDVQLAQSRLNTLGRLNRSQALSGAFVMAGFLLGLAALLTNPVPGPHAADRSDAGVNAWTRSLQRLKTKRRWIIASLMAQLGATASIVYLGMDVL